MSRNWFRNGDFRQMNTATDRKLLTYELVVTIILIPMALCAVILIIMGLSKDLGNGNRSFNVARQTVTEHANPTFTFCAGGELDTVLPNISYCSFSRSLSLKANATAEREWGLDSGNCVTDMQAAGLNLFTPHPLEPECWMLSGDLSNELVPERAGEVMEIDFSADAIVMRVWNSTDEALVSFPSNSSFSQGVRAIFGAVDLVHLYEGYTQSVGGPKEISYTLREFGSLQLATLGEEDVSIVVLSWGSDVVDASVEREAVSPLTLTAIVLGALVVVVELIGRNLVLLTYQLFFYSPDSASHEMAPAKKRRISSSTGSKDEVLSDPYGTLKGKPNPAAGGGWDEGVTEL